MSNSFNEHLIDANEAAADVYEAMRPLGDSFDTGRGTRILGGIEYAIPGTGNACGAANDCCRVRGHEGDHINASGRRWGLLGFSQGESWIDIFKREQVLDRIPRPEGRTK